MRSYSTLGTGKSTKVIDAPDTPSAQARTVTTCDAETAGFLARVLTDTDRKLPAALHPVAVELDGTPVQARRHLLEVFDRAVAAHPDRVPADIGPWFDAEHLVIRLAETVAGYAPAAVIAAVRTELAGHLDGFDGVLVPAVADYPGSRRLGTLPLVLSGALDAMSDQWWFDVLGEHTDLDMVSDPNGKTQVRSHEFYMLCDYLTDAEPATTKYEHDSMITLVQASIPGDIPVEFDIAHRHLEAWIAHHRPADLPRYREIAADCGV